MSSTLMSSIASGHLNAINKVRLVEILKSIKGAKFVGVTTKTEPKMRKADNPYTGRVFKITNFNATLNADYEKSVNRQREREGRITDFEALPNWQVPIIRPDGTKTPLVAKSDGTKTYLQMKVEKSSSILIDEYGRPYSDHEVNLIKSFMPPISESRQDVSKEIVIRTVDIDNIKEFRFGGVEYVVS